MNFLIKVNISVDFFLKFRYLTVKRMFNALLYAPCKEFKIFISMICFSDYK